MQRVLGMSCIRVVMVASSYPRFHGDSVGSFMEPIAQGIAARGHEVHLVAPWHPKWNRPKVESRRPLPSVPLRAGARR